MNQHSDIDRVLSRWLEDGPHTMPCLVRSKERLYDSFAPTSSRASTAAL